MASFLSTKTRSGQALRAASAECAVLAEVGAPAPVRGDVRRVGERDSLADEAVDAAAIGELDACRCPAVAAIDARRSPTRCIGIDHTSTSIARAAFGHAQQTGLGRR